MQLPRRHSLALLLAAGLCALPFTAPVRAAQRPLKIIVFGGTGTIGQRIVVEALGRGHFVVAVARNPDRLEVAGAGLAVTRGDVADTEQVTRLITGQDVIISAVNVGRGNDSQGDDFLERAARSLVAAMRHVGPHAPRLIVVGGAGSLEVAPGVTLIDQWRQSGAAFLAAPLQQQRVLEYLRTVRDVSWAYFSPAMEIAPGARTGRFRLGGEQLVRDTDGNSRISIDDYAMAAIDEAERPAHLRQRFTIGY